jgi:hypothetical protein
VRHSYQVCLLLEADSSWRLKSIFHRHKTVNGRQIIQTFEDWSQLVAVAIKWEFPAVKKIATEGLFNEFWHNVRRGEPLVEPRDYVFWYRAARHDNFKDSPIPIPVAQQVIQMLVNRSTPLTLSEVERLRPDEIVHIQHVREARKDTIVQAAASLLQQHSAEGFQKLLETTNGTKSS